MQQPMWAVLLDKNTVAYKNIKNDMHKDKYLNFNLRENQYIPFWMIQDSVQPFPRDPNLL